MADGALLELSEALKAYPLPEHLFWLEVSARDDMVLVAQPGQRGYRAVWYAWLAHVDADQNMYAYPLGFSLKAAAIYATEGKEDGEALAKRIEKAVREFQGQLDRGEAPKVRDLDALPMPANGS